MQTEEVPDEVWQAIYAFLPYKDLIHMSTCSKRTQSMVTPLLKDACDYYIFSHVLHADAKRIIALLKDETNKLVYWALLNDGPYVETTLVSNARQCLNEIVTEHRQKLYWDGFCNMVNTWTEDKSPTQKRKKQRTCCSALDCKKQPLPTGMCGKHTAQLLSSSDVYVIQFIEKFITEFSDATGHKATLAKEKNYEELLVESILGAPEEREEEDTDIDWHPGFTISSFVYGYYSGNDGYAFDASFAVFVGKVDEEFENNENRDREVEDLVYESDDEEDEDEEKNE